MRSFDVSKPALETTVVIGVHCSLAIDYVRSITVFLLATSHPATAGLEHTALELEQLRRQD